MEYAKVLSIIKRVTTFSYMAIVCAVLFLIWIICGAVLMEKESTVGIIFVIIGILFLVAAIGLNIFNTIKMLSTKLPGVNDGKLRMYAFLNIIAFATNIITIKEFEKKCHSENEYNTLLAQRAMNQQVASNMQNNNNNMVNNQVQPQQPMNNQGMQTGLTQQMNVPNQIDPMVNNQVQAQPFNNPGMTTNLTQQMNVPNQVNNNNQPMFNNQVQPQQQPMNNPGMSTGLTQQMNIPNQINNNNQMVNNQVQPQQPMNNQGMQTGLTQQMNIPNQNVNPTINNNFVPPASNGMANDPNATKKLPTWNPPNKDVK